jgi:FixJ family two-component response regulator
MPLISIIDDHSLTRVAIENLVRSLGFSVRTFASAIIFITAYPDEDIKARALSAGAICFLQKPLELQGVRIAECLQAALSRGRRPDPAT